MRKNKYYETSGTAWVYFKLKIANEIELILAKCANSSTQSKDDENEILFDYILVDNDKKHFHK